ncbi:MAG: peptide ABC transporter substrate-binding protein [Myxococcaceae bacterium]|nr:peptide ABC transporter substrate-binding protein [Myxococcaceae bacterium]
MPTTLDWNTSDPTSWVNYPVMLATMRGLTSLGPDNTIRPGLASSWTRERTPEGHEAYTFQLRRDVRWSDGAPLVAQDFVLGWRRAAVGKERGEVADVLGAEPVLAAIARGAPKEEVDALLEGLEVRALDAHTLRIVLTRPRSYFLARMANVYLFFPAPSAQLAGKSEEEIRAYFERPQDGHPVSLGPWRVEAWDRAGERIRLVRNPVSAFAPAPIDGFVPPERVTLLRSEIGPALFERNRVGFVFVDSAIALQQAPTADLQRRELLSTYFLGFNTERPPMDRAEVRRAIAQALDRDALLQGLLPAARPTRTLLPPDLPGAMSAEDERRLVTYDPEAARPVLRAVDRPLRLVFKAGESFIPEVAIAERIRAQLAKVGVKVELDARYDFSAELARRGPDARRTFDLYLRRIGADYAHPKTFFTLFERNGNHQTGWETCDGGTSIRRFEALLAQGDAAADPETARRAYTAAQLLLLREEAVIVPLYHPDRYYRRQSGLRGVEVDPFNFISLGDLQVRKDAR